MNKDFGNYIIPLDDYNTRFVKAEINRLGFDNWYNEKLKYTSSDRVFGGQRIMQTDSYIYRSSLSELVFGIGEVYSTSQEVFNKLMDKVIELHNKNIEYEKINPPISIKQTRKESIIKDNDDKDSKKEIKKKNKFNIPGQLTFNFNLK